MNFSVNFGAALLVVLFGVLASSNTSPYPDDLEVRGFNIGFFANQVPIEYAPDMVIEVNSELNNSSLDRIINRLESKPLNVLLNSLLEQKKTLQLNDFLFYKLAQQSVAVIYKGQQTNARTLTLFSLMARSGYDVRLTYRKDKAFLNIHTEEDLFEVPIIDHSGRAYANISCLNGSCKARQSLYIYRRQPNPKGRSFSFKLDQWPLLDAKPTLRPLTFNFHGVTQKLDVQFDQTMVDIMSDYPFIHEYAYLDTPLSPTLSKSLLPPLRRMLAQLSEREQLELLVSFTRSAFLYKEDNEYFGRSKPMVPEELFSYDFSDCEDRSALVRELLDTPMAVIAYDDHLTIAVASETIMGDHFDYQGKRYVFCDPTGPSGSSRIGEIPPGYENKSFQIIGEHN